MAHLARSLRRSDFVCSWRYPRRADEARRTGEVDPTRLEAIRLELDHKTGSNGSCEQLVLCWSAHVVERDMEDGTETCE